MVNIREHDSWVHTDREEATAKAKALARAAIQRVALHKALEVKKVPVHPDVLVVGGGIAGIHAALTLANAGQEGLPRRARALHRRAHGQVRQDASRRWIAPPASSRRRCPRSARTRTSRCGATPRS